MERDGGALRMSYRVQGKDNHVEDLSFFLFLPFF